MDGRCGAAVRNMASGLACSVMGQIGASAWPQATAPPIEHVVLVDARLWQESHAEIEAHLRCGGFFSNGREVAGIAGDRGRPGNQ